MKSPTTAVVGCACTAQERGKEGEMLSLSPLSNLYFGPVGNSQRRTKHAGAAGGAEAGRGLRVHPCTCGEGRGGQG